jgi:hypothetical protein
VEWQQAEDALLIWVELMGEFGEKSSAKRAFIDVFEQRGMQTQTEMIHRAAGAVGQLGQLIPDVAAYIPPNNSGPYGQRRNHGDIVVEIEFLDQAADALKKPEKYFEAGFLGPKGTYVKEVWIVLLSRIGLDLPAEPLVDGPFTPLVAFNGALPEPPDGVLIIVYYSRNDAEFHPCMSFIEWNTTVSVPAGSLYPGGGFGANGVLRRLYLSKQLSCLPVSVCPQVSRDLPCFFDALFYFHEPLQCKRLQHARRAELKDGEGPTTL